MTKALSLLRNLSAFVLLAAVCALETSRRFELFGQTPSLIPATVVTLALILGEGPGALLGMAAGLLRCASGELFILYAPLYFTAGLLWGRSRSRLRVNVLTVVAAAAVTAPVVNLIYSVAVWLFGRAGLTPTPGTDALSSATAALLLYPVVCGIARISRRTAAVRYRP